MGRAEIELSLSFDVPCFWGRAALRFAVCSPKSLAQMQKRRTTPWVSFFLWWGNTLDAGSTLGTGMRDSIAGFPYRGNRMDAASF